MEAITVLDRTELLIPAGIDVAGEAILADPEQVGSQAYIDQGFADMDTFLGAGAPVSTETASETQAEELLSALNKSMLSLVVMAMKWKDQDRAKAVYEGVSQNIVAYNTALTPPKLDQHMFVLDLLDRKEEDDEDEE